MMWYDLIVFIDITKARYSLLQTRQAHLVLKSNNEVVSTSLLVAGHGYSTYY